MNAVDLLKKVVITWDVRVREIYPDPFANTLKIQVIRTPQVDLSALTEDEREFLISEIQTGRVGI